MCDIGMVSERERKVYAKINLIKNIRTRAVYSQIIYLFSMR